MSNSHWTGYLDKLRPAAELNRLSWRPDDPLVEAEVHRQVMMNLSLGYLCYFGGDGQQPDFIPFLNSAYLLQPNPDDTYFVAFLDAKRGYRISGDRGSVHLLTLTVGAHMMECSEEKGRLLFELDMDEVADENGVIDLVISPQKPADHSGAWREMPADADFILVRQRSYLWGAERDARLAVTPLELQHRGRLSPAEINRRIEGQIAFAGRLTRLWLQYLQGLRERPVHEVRLTTYDGGVQAQRYWEAVLDFAPDEALILDTEIPGQARYWNIQLNDMIWNTVDYVYRQSSLNGAQATLDSDGRFRAVISQADPGVPNWLDTGGNNVGTLVGRWYECDSHPLPTLRKVPLAEVRDHLPADTPQVTPPRRKAALLERARGAQLRRRW